MLYYNDTKLKSVSLLRNKGHSGSMETEEITQRPHGHDLMNSRLLHHYHMEEETDRYLIDMVIPY